MFKEKILSLGGAIILMIICMTATYFVTNSLIEPNTQIEMPSIPPIHTQKPAEFTDKDLFLYACIDSFDVQENEIVDLPVINKPTSMVAFNNSGTVLCYSLEEIKSKKPSDKRQLLGLLGLSPDSNLNNAIVFTASPENLFRPAYSTDCSKKDMASTQQELTQQQKEFITALMYDAYNKEIAYTRLGYTYNYLGESVYGVAQYAININHASDVKEYNLDDFFKSIS